MERTLRLERLARERARVGIETMVEVADTGADTITGQFERIASRARLVQMRFVAMATAAAGGLALLFSRRRGVGKGLRGATQGFAGLGQSAAEAAGTMGRVFSVARAIARLSLPAFLTTAAISTVANNWRELRLSFGGFADAWATHWPRISQAGGEFGSQIAEAVSAWDGAIASYMANVERLFGGEWSDQEWTNVGHAIGRITAGVSEMFLDIGTNIVWAIEQVGHLSSAISDTIGFVIDLTSASIDAVTAMFTDLVAWFQALPERIVEVFSGLGSRIVEAIGSIEIDWPRLPSWLGGGSDEVVEQPAARPQRPM